MEQVYGGAIKDIIDTLKKLSEKLYNYLSAGDHKNSNSKLTESKETREDEYDNKYMYKGKIPYKVHIKIKDDTLADIKVSVDISGHKEKSATNVKNTDFDKTVNKIVEGLLDEDDLKSFGLSASCKVKFTLQKIVGSRQDSIKLTSVRAFCEIPEAQSVLDIALGNDEFLASVPEVPTMYGIDDIDDEIDVYVVNDDCRDTDLIRDSIYQMLCSAIKFEMNAQTLTWEAAFDGRFISMMNDLRYIAQEDVNKYGMWLVEISNAVANPYTSQPELWLSKCELEDFHSPQIESIGLEKIFDVLTDYINTLDFFYPNLPHDLQSDIDYRLRRLREIRDIGLKQII